jgi:hypothetical protein
LRPPSEYVFANSTGAGPINPNNIYNRHLFDVADNLKPKIPHKILYRLEEIAKGNINRELARRPDLPAYLGERVLRLQPRLPKMPLQVTPFELGGMFEVLNRIADEILGTTPAAAERAPLAATPPTAAESTAPPAGSSLDTGVEEPASTPLTFPQLLRLAMRVSTQTRSEAAVKMDMSERHLAKLLSGEAVKPRHVRVRKSVKKYLKAHLPDHLKKI